MSRRAWTLIAVLVVLGGLIGGYFWLTRPKSAPAAATTSTKLSSGDKDKLVKIVLSGRPEGTLTLVKKGTTWNTVPPTSAKLSTSNIDDLLYSFSALFAERTIDQNPTDLGKYGLQPPQATAVGTWDDGTAHTMYLGNKTDAGNTYYLQVKGDPKVYTVWMNHGEHYHWTVKDLRDKTIAPAINYDEVTYLKLVQRGGTVIEVKEKTAEESTSFQLGMGKYLLTRPYSYLRGLDTEKQDSLIKGPQSITIADIIEDNPKDLGTYGLARPWGEAVVRDKSNTIDFIFGAEKGSQTYFMIKGTPTVYTVDTNSLSFMGTRAFDVVDKFSFIPNIDDVDRIAITASGTTHTLAIARTTQKAEKAGDPDVVVATYTVDGKSVEETNFKNFYQSVIGLTVEGEVSRAVPDKPEVAVRFALNKGPTKSVTIDYAPYDRDFDAIFINGINEFALTKGQLSAMLSKLDSLVKGEPVSN